MGPKFLLQKDAFAIENYHQARPFSSFLPGIAGFFGKPMWVFYTNRGQGIASFGVRNKNGAMLEFYPANKAYSLTPLLGFRTFIRYKKGSRWQCYEPFRVNAGPEVRQVLYVRPHEIEVEETHRALGLRTRIAFFTAPNEELPVFIRQVQLENLRRQPFQAEIADGLPQVVPYGLAEAPLKLMSRTMEAFAEAPHVQEKLPFFKMKTEPSDKPEVEWITAGFFAFSFLRGNVLPIVVDPVALFDTETSFQSPVAFSSGKPVARAPQQAESRFGCAFAYAPIRVGGHQSIKWTSYYGQADDWQKAAAFRQRVAADSSYGDAKRQENALVVSRIAENFAVHSASPEIDAYTRQSYLDNVLRGGFPVILTDGEASQMFHAFTRKHGDMERDYNFFELAPTYFSQGNGNYRDVNQNRRSESLLHVGVGSENVETFFNLLQLDGFNPLVIQAEKFRVGEKYGRPGDLFEKHLKAAGSREDAFDDMTQGLARATKIQDAQHGEGFWVDHWAYNLDLLETYAAAYPDELGALLGERKIFTYFDNDHVVQPRDKKYVLRHDGAIRQMHAVVRDAEKSRLLRQRKDDPHIVRIQGGTGPIYRSTLLAKMLGLVAVKAATLDPFGIGLEMESDKPGWCDALNGLPGLLGSSTCESFELLRWVRFLTRQLDTALRDMESHAVAEEVAQLIRAVGEALALARPDDFFKTWDTLGSLKERFRESTRLGVTGEEKSLSRGEMMTFLERVRKVLEAGLARAIRSDGLCVTYYINEVTAHEKLPVRARADDGESAPAQCIKALRFRQVPLAPYLEGPVHAMRVARGREDAQKIYSAVRHSELYDRKLKMYKLNVPLTEESYEIGRSKIFTPGWLENESIFLHMHYKFLLEVLRSGLYEEFFAEIKNGIVPFRDPHIYGRSPSENSSFIASSRFPDSRVHGTGYVARLSGSTAEWLSMVLYMALGPAPFQSSDHTLRFEPRPVLPKSLFSAQAQNGFAKNTFAFKLFGKTWVVYSNPSRKDTFGASAVRPRRYQLDYESGQAETVEGDHLPDAMARDLRNGKLVRLSIELR